MPVAGTATRSSAGGWLFDQPYLLLALTSLFWAGNTVLGRYLVGHIPPVTLAFVRWAGAALVLLPFAVPHLARDWPAIRKHAVLMTVLALCGFSTYNTMAYYGLKYTSAINGLLLQSFGPLLVALWSFALYRERLTPRQAGGVCISLVGVIVIVSHGSLDVLIGLGLNRGDVWFLIALLFYTYYTVALRQRPKMHTLSFLTVAMGWGAVLMLPAVAFELAGGPVLVLDTVTFASFVYVCIFPSALGYLFLNRGIELVGANRAAPFLHLVPVFGSIMAVALLGERFEVFHAVGYALVFTGITVATRKPR